MPVAGEWSAAMPGRVRLDLAQLVGVDAPQARHAVRPAAALELVERGELRAVERDDQLAAPLDGDVRAARRSRRARGRPPRRGAP